MTRKIPFFMQMEGKQSYLWKTLKWKKLWKEKRTYDLINLVDERIKALKNIERSQV